MTGTDSAPAGGADAGGGSDAGADSRERIMRATYCALCKHDYASLTTQDIADESDLSKAALHYHYDSKADLLRAFLEYLLDSFRERATAETADEGPFERVRTLVGLLFEPPGGDADAEFVVTVSNGAHTRRVALGRTTDCAETQLLDYLEALRVEDGDERREGDGR
ncbi:MAG: TetR/AcrR family transcriptional regulator [Haloarculaceae archaeon]